MSNRNDPFAAFRRRHSESGVPGVLGVPKSDLANESTAFSATEQGTRANLEGVPRVPKLGLETSQGTQGTPRENKGVPNRHEINCRMYMVKAPQGTQGTPGTRDLDENLLHPIEADRFFHLDAALYSPLQRAPNP
jgi:hypothetical protein